MKTLLLLPLFLISLAAHSQECAMRAEFREEFGRSRFSESFQQKIESILQEKGYVLVDDAKAPYQLEVVSDYGFPCGTGVTTADEIFRNYSYASLSLNTSGKKTEAFKRRWNFPLLPTGAHNQRKLILKLLKQLPECWATGEKGD